MISPTRIDQNTVFEHLASSVVLPRQELLSTYLILWWHGRGGRLRSESLFGGSYKSGNQKNNEIKHRKIIISTMSIRHAQIVDGTNNYWLFSVFFLISCMSRENTLFGPRKWSTKCGSQAMNDAPGVMDDVSLNKLPQISFWCMLSEVGFDKSNNELPMHPRCTNPCLWCAGSSPCAFSPFLIPSFGFFPYISDTVIQWLIPSSFAASPSCPCRCRHLHDGSCSMLELPQHNEDSSRRHASPMGGAWPLKPSWWQLLGWLSPYSQWHDELGSGSAPWAPRCPRTLWSVGDQVHLDIPQVLTRH